MKNLKQKFAFAFLFALVAFLAVWGVPRAEAAEAQKAPKYIANLQAMNPKDDYILWGLLSITQIKDYNWRVSGHIINNYNDREIIALNTGNIVYSAGIQGYDRGVRTKGMNKYIFPNPIKPGTRIQFNIPLNDSNVSSFSWKNATFTTRKIQNTRDNDGSTTIIIKH